jgi:hypothetical protein
MTELLPCPFCAGSTTYQPIEAAPEFAHMEVHHNPGCFFKEKVSRMLVSTECVSAWNHRALSVLRTSTMSAPLPAAPLAHKEAP